MAVRLTFGEWLDDQLQTRRWTQAAFADLVGVGRSTVTMWVNDTQPPRRRSARDIAHALGAEIDEVLVRAGYPPQTPGYVLPEDREPEPEPPTIDRFQSVRDQLGSLRMEIRSLEEVMPREGIPVRYVGRVAAGGVDRIVRQEGDDVRDVLPGWLNGRAPEEFRVVLACGDRLLASYGHIAGGDLVLFDLRREPAAGEIVLVRRDGVDEWGMVLWPVALDELTVVGVFVDRWGSRLGSA